MRVLWILAAALCALLPSPSRAQAFTVDDLLRLQEVAGAQFAPGGRWLVVHTYAGQSQTGVYDYDHQYRRLQGRLSLVDLRRPGPARDLLPAEPGTGYSPGPFSPSGQTLLVNRLKDHRWQAGLVDLASSQVRWLDLSLDLPIWGRSAAWTDAAHLVAIVTPADSPPLWLRTNHGPQQAIPERWAKAARGEEAVTAIGSGRYLSRGAPAPTKQLVVIDARSGATRVLASGEYYDLELSPNGRYVAAARLAADIQPRSDDKLIGASAIRRREVDVLDLKTGRLLHPCPACDITSHLLAWSPGSAQLLVYARRPGEAWPAGRLQRLNVGTQTAQPLTASSPAIDLTGEGLELVQAGWIDGQPVAWSGAPGAAAWRAVDPLLRVDLGGAAAKAGRLASLPGALIALVDHRALRRDRHGGWSDLGAFDPIATPVFGEGSRLGLGRLLTASELWGRDRERLVRIDAAGARTPAEALEPGDRVIAAAGDDVLLARADPHGATRLILARRGRGTTIARLNGFLDQVAFGPVKPIHHLGPDGRPRVSWLVLPPGWTPGQKPAVIALPYPGHAFGEAPPAAALPGSTALHHNAQLIAAHGLAALFPSLPRDQVGNEPGLGMAEDILAAVDAAGDQGLVDTTRVGVWGQSFGGYAALMAASQSPRFKAVIATAAATDLSFSHGRVMPWSRVSPEDGLSFVASMGWAEQGQAGLGAPPWRAPERYWRNSPRFAVEKMTAPVLLAYGDLDPIGLDEGEAMFSALYREGKDARLLTFWGEGHVILGPGNVRRLYREALGFLDETLVAVDAAPPDRPVNPAP